MVENDRQFLGVEIDLIYSLEERGDFIFIIISN